MTSSLGSSTLVSEFCVKTSQICHRNFNCSNGLNPIKARVLTGSETMIAWYLLHCVMKFKFAKNETIMAISNRHSLFKSKSMHT